MSMWISHRRWVLLLIATAAVATLACTESGTPESQVRDLVEHAEQAAEERDLSDVMELVADSYADKHGQSKAGIRDLMRGFFYLNQSVHLLVRTEDIQFPSDDVATAAVTVGMLGRQSADDWTFAAETYEFDIRLRKVDDEWQLQSADWRRNGL